MGLQVWLALAGVPAALLLAAWSAWRAVDPPYRGVHERGAGRHRHRDWEGEGVA